MKTTAIKVLFALLPLSFASCGGDSGADNSGTDTAVAAPADAHHADGHVDDHSTTGAGDDNAMMTVMNTMMSDMKGMTMTNDPDHDFAAMMRRHHQGAIEMVQAYLPTGHHKEVKDMAQKMMSDQHREVTELDAFLASHKPSRNEAAISQQMMQTMDNMGMGATSPDVDQQFVSLMIPHHQSAVDMSQAYLKGAQDPKMKAMAQNIISSQQKEIQELKDWQAKGHSGGH